MVFEDKILHMGPVMCGVARLSVFQPKEGELNAWTTKDGRILTLDELVNCFFQDPRKNWKATVFYRGEYLNDALQKKGLVLNAKFQLPFPRDW